MAPTTRILSHVGPMPGVSAELPEVELLPIPTEGSFDAGLRGDVLITTMRGGANLAEVLERGVRWIHTIGTGIEDFPLQLVGDRLLTCSRGSTSVYIAEWIIAQLLTVEKQLPAAWVHEPPATWGGPQLGSLRDATVAVLGFGTIGTALARRLLPFDTTVRAMRRSDAPSPVAGVELVRDTARLVAGADHVVLAAPLTDATRGIVDADFLAAMRPGAHLVNVARAGLTDDAALHAALDSGQLGTASLDVAPVEPLPAEHWYYQHPRVRFSPHVSWSGSDIWQTMQRSFLDNYRHWAQGKTPPDIVDLVHGY
jgi:phosphoglycerate dehydrogenase-like enzyme